MLVYLNIGPLAIPFLSKQEQPTLMISSGVLRWLPQGKSLALSARSYQPASPGSLDEPRLVCRLLPGQLFLFQQASHQLASSALDEPP